MIFGAYHGARGSPSRIFQPTSIPPIATAFVWRSPRRAILGPYETDFRILIGEEVRWIAARGQGEDVGIVGRTTATGIALVIHELATNSMNYGALSAPTGTLDVSSIADGKDVVLTWLERGGPMVEAPTVAAGFGSKLVQRSVTGQLGGAIHYNWSEGGLIVTLRMDRSRLAS